MAAARIVLDTDVASLSYKGRLPAWLASRLVGQEICVTFVTIGELARWAEKRHWGTRARTELVDWLGRRVVLPYDEFSVLTSLVSACGGGSWTRSWCMSCPYCSATE